MNIDIKPQVFEYRAKQEDNNKWVYGQLVEIDQKYFIFDYDYMDNGITQTQHFQPIFMKIIQETIGAYTGRRDEKGVKLYQGDIVAAELCGIEREFAIANNENLIDYKTLFVVDWDIDCHYSGWNIGTDSNIFVKLGDIHTNPELLQKKEFGV